MQRVWTPAHGLAALGLCVVILATGLPLPAHADPGLTVQHLEWQTSTLAGDFAVRLDMQFTQLTHCSFRIAGTGPLRPYDLLLYQGADDNPERGAAFLGGGGTVVTVGPANFQFHTTPSDTYWVAAIDGSITLLPGRQGWVFAGFGLQPLGVPHPITDHSFDLRASCDRPFALLGVDAAREAFGASNANLEEGMGIRVAPTPQPQPSVLANLADGVTRTTTGDATWLLARDTADAASAGAGALVHLHPDDVAMVPYLAGTLAYLHRGPSGEQLVRITHTAAGTVNLYLMVIGFRDVGGLAGLDTWPFLPTY